MSKTYTITYNITTECTLTFTDEDLQAFECDSPSRLKQAILDAYEDNRRRSSAKPCPLHADLWARIMEDATENDWSFQPDSLRVDEDQPGRHMDGTDAMREFMAWMTSGKGKP